MYPLLLILLSLLSHGAKSIDCFKGVYKYQNTCYSCTPGKYNIDKNAEECKSCKEGFFAHSVYERCKYCKPGYYANGGQCAPCPWGTYSNAGANRLRDCKVDIKPWPRHRILQSYYTGCPLGTVTSETGCDPCRRGGYAGIGALSCIKCSEGTFNQYDNSSSCSTCITGYYSSGIISGRCNQCAKGYYNYYLRSYKRNTYLYDYKPAYPEFNELICISCPIGKTTPTHSKYFSSENCK